MRRTFANQTCVTTTKHKRTRIQTFKSTKRLHYTMTSEGNNTATAMMLSNIVAPVFERPRVGLTLLAIVRDCCETIRNHEDLTDVQCPSETELFWDALRFARRRWKTIVLPDNVLNDSRIRNDCTGIFSVLSYDRRLANYDLYRQQLQVMPAVGERVQVSTTGMTYCFGAQQARIRDSSATVCIPHVPHSENRMVSVEFSPLSEGGRGRRRRALVNYNEDSDNEDEAESKPKSESKPQMADITPSNPQFTLPREDIIRNGDLRPQREPQIPSIIDVARVLRLVSYILFTASFDRLMSSRCDDIAATEIPDWLEDAGLGESNDEHSEKWTAIMENCQDFETEVVENINVTTICGNIADLSTAWGRIDGLSFDY